MRENFHKIINEDIYNQQIKGHLETFSMLIITKEKNSKHDNLNVGNETLSKACMHTYINLHDKSITY